jgi:hypothetical protein
MLIDEVIWRVELYIPPTYGFISTLSRLWNILPSTQFGMSHVALAVTLVVVEQKVVR